MFIIFCVFIFMLIKESKKDTKSAATFRCFHSIINKKGIRLEILLTINIKHAIKESL